MNLFTRILSIYIPFNIDFLNLQVLKATKKNLSELIDVIFPLYNLSEYLIQQRNSKRSTKIKININ